MGFGIQEREQGWVWKQDIVQQPVSESCCELHRLSRVLRAAGTQQDTGRTGGILP